MTNYRMRILLFSRKGAGTHYYGPGMSAYRMYRDLSPEVATVSLVHGLPEQKQFEPFENQYLIADSTKNGLLSEAVFLMKLKKWIRSHIRDYDVVHCLSGFHHSFLFAWWSEQQGVPAYIKITESKSTGFTRSSLLSNLLGLRRFRIRHANEISGYISISSEITQKLLKAGIQKEKIHFIPNGVNIQRFYPSSYEDKVAKRKKLGLKERFTVLFTGGFSERKNPHLICQAFEPYMHRDDIQLLLIGPDRDHGEERNRILQFLRQKEAANVYLLDFVEEIDEYYKASDLFILPSVEEGLSNSLLEAQACGLPAVVTRISGSEDLVEKGVNGTFVITTPKSIRQAIHEYFHNSEKLREESVGARKKIVQQYSSNKILKSHLDLFVSQRHPSSN